MEDVLEPCLRCGAGMDWRHGTWQCPRCRFKLGCCEGEASAAACDRQIPAGAALALPANDYDG